MTLQPPLTPLFGLLTCALLSCFAEAAPTSTLTGISLPASSRPVGGSALKTLSSQLGSLARAHKLTGSCQGIEAFILNLDDDDAVDALEVGFRKAGYAVADLPGASDDELAFTLRKGRTTVMAVIEFGESTVLAWCPLGTASASPSAPPKTATVPPARAPATPQTANPAPASPPGGAAQGGRAPTATTGLEGLYFRLRMTANSSIEEYFYFLPNGRVALVLPEGGLDPVDQGWIARLQREHPDHVATYRLEGGDIVFSVPGKPSWRESFAREANGNLSLGGHFTTRVARFTNGQRMEAQYTFAGGASGGGTAVSSGSSLTLRADGTFALSGLVGASMRTGGQTQTARSSSQSSGRYQLSGNTLILNHADGRTTRHTVFPYALKGDPGPNPRWFYLDGMQMKLAR
ncbi:hypothetical protein [Deinococcus yavapaiensis]|uniref:Uncharacterized protein n=1 Tax=Deinococcus yavapaiensis KR-236 TaxID=694435 RepID=A0A318SD30_9DEIO|nr:hypothetical protein [Deinococcus yavapaiensis]PYE56553.1 hypothetical protein DES52_101358 [Deinococcus yavapaiensis KR-236]